MNQKSDQDTITSSATEISFTEQMVEVPGGKVWLRTYGKGPETPIVMLHGGPGSPSDYLWPLNVLAVDRPVVFYDQLGCGQSERGQPSDYQLDRFVEELGSILDHLNYDQCILFGHSWGSMLAVETALRWSDRFKAIILASPCLSMERTRKDMNQLRSELPERIQKVLLDLEESQQTESPIYQIAALPFYQRHICRLNPWPETMEASPDWGLDVYRSMWGPAEFLPQGSLSDFEREQDLKLLEMPILFTCGRHDEITPEATTSYYEASNNGQLHIFENSAHVAHLEEPDAFLKIMNGFLESLNKSSYND